MVLWPLVGALLTGVGSTRITGTGPRANLFLCRWPGTPLGVLRHARRPTFVPSRHPHSPCGPRCTGGTAGSPLGSRAVLNLVLLRPRFRVPPVEHRACRRDPSGCRAGSRFGSHGRRPGPSGIRVFLRGNRVETSGPGAVRGPRLAISEWRDRPSEGNRHCRSEPGKP